MKRIKELSKKLESADYHWEETNSLIERLPDAEYYKRFGRKAELEIDLEKARKTKRRLENEIYALLENLKTECDKQLRNVSQEMKFKKVLTENN